MITQQRSARMKNSARPSVLLGRLPTASERLGRAIQFALALYLMPVLLVVLAVGGLGMLILGYGRWLTGPGRGSSVS
jgi:hypothetical protein